MDKTARYLLWDMDPILSRYSLMRKDSMKKEARLERSVFRDIFPTLFDHLLRSERDFQRTVSEWIESRILELHDSGVEVILHNGCEMI